MAIWKRANCMGRFREGSNPNHFLHGGACTGSKIPPRFGACRKEWLLTPRDVRRLTPPSRQRVHRKGRGGAGCWYPEDKRGPPSIMVLVDRLASKSLVRELGNRFDPLAQFPEPGIKIPGCGSFRRAGCLALGHLGQRLFNNLLRRAVRRASQLLAERLFGLRSACRSGGFTPPWRGKLAATSAGAGLKPDATGFCCVQAGRAMANPIARIRKVGVLRNLIATSRASRGLRKIFGVILLPTRGIATFAADSVVGQSARRRDR